MSQPQRGYFLDTYEDRDRLTSQYELLRPAVLGGLARAMAVAGLDPDSASAAWHILDVGCGEGLYTNFLTQQHPHWQIMGIDRDDEAIMTAETVFGLVQPQITFAIHDILTPFPATLVPPGTVDLAMAVLVLCHTSDVQAALHHIAASLRPGRVLYSLDLISPHNAFFPGSPALLEIARLADTALALRCSPTYGTDPEPLLRAAGLTLCASERVSYPLGGATADGQAMLRNVVQALYATRHGPIMGGLITAEAWQDLYERVQTEIRPEMTGTWTLSSVIARRDS